MFNISHDGIISMSRGDTITATLYINAGTEICPIRYELKDGDKLYFGICEPNHNFENAIVRKMYAKDDFVFNDCGDIILTILPKDTEYLEDGLYYYTIKLVSVSEDGQEEVQTIIQKKKLYIED